MGHLADEKVVGKECCWTTFPCFHWREWKFSNELTENFALCRPCFNLEESRCFENLCPAALVKQNNYGKGVIHFSSGWASDNLMWALATLGHEEKFQHLSWSCCAPLVIATQGLSHKGIEERVSADLHSQASVKELRWGNEYLHYSIFSPLSSESYLIRFWGCFCLFY